MSDRTRDVEIASVGDFELALRRVQDRHRVFRGEDKACYLLRPRAGRFEPAATAVETGQALLEEFKARARPVVSCDPANDWEWLALAHHHGLATRLLEWTDNPMVATFWAVQEPYLGGDRVLWVLDCTSLPAGPRAGASPFEVTEVMLYRAERRGEHVSTQCGVFTVHPHPTRAFESDLLERWIIRERALSGVCVTVDGYGTEEEACTYADLDFLCRKLNWDREVGLLSDAVAPAR